MSPAAPIVFLDTETTGLNVDGDGDWIWDFAAIRREPDGTETSLECQVQHDPGAANKLPEPFWTDYKTRYDEDRALSWDAFRTVAGPLFAGRPHIVGAVPDFDTVGLRQLLGVNRIGSPWHYHLIDVEALAVGYLRAKRKFGPYRPGQIEEATRLPYDSDLLSAVVGVDPAQFDRHTAMGDVRWARAIYDVVMGYPMTQSIPDREDDQPYPLAPRNPTSVELGQVAYEAYRQMTDYRSLVAGVLLPAWTELTPELRQAWRGAADGVRMFLELRP